MFCCNKQWKKRKRLRKQLNQRKNMFVSTCVSVDMWAHVSVWTCEHAWACVDMSVCVDVCMSIRVWALVNVCTCGRVCAPVTSGHQVWPVPHPGAPRRPSVGPRVSAHVRTGSQSLRSLKLLPENGPPGVPSPTSPFSTSHRASLIQHPAGVSTRAPGKGVWCGGWAWVTAPERGRSLQSCQVRSKDKCC